MYSCLGRAIDTLRACKNGDLTQVPATTGLISTKGTGHGQFHGTYSEEGERIRCFILQDTTVSRHLDKLVLAVICCSAELLLLRLHIMISMCSVAGRMHAPQYIAMQPS